MSSCVNHQELIWAQSAAKGMTVLGTSAPTCVLVVLKATTKKPKNKELKSTCKPKSRLKNARRQERRSITVKTENVFLPNKSNTTNQTRNYGISRRTNVEPLGYPPTYLYQTSASYEAYKGINALFANKSLSNITSTTSSLCQKVASTNSTTFSCYALLAT